MASTTIPGPGPAVVTEANLELLLAPGGGDGFLGTPADTSIVFADGAGMTVKFRAGKYGLLRGSAWASGESDISKSVSANSSGQTRIDRAVLRLNRTGGSAWIVTEEVLTGTPGSSTGPALTQDLVDGVWELLGADITVVNGATSIGASDVARREVYLGEQPVLYTQATRPGSAPLGQLGLCTDLGSYGTWEYWAGSQWVALNPSTVANATRWNNYQIVVSASTPGGSPSADRIWFKPAV